MQRVKKLLEDAQIKLSSVVSDIFGVSERAMLEALVAGQRDPKVLAQIAKARMRTKPAELEEALRGFFTDHHAAILRMMLDSIDRHSEQIAALDTKIEAAIAPFARQVAQLDEITGVGATAAQELIAEIGVDMGRFPSHAHLVSWAKFCPQVHESAGKAKPKGRGRGNPWLAGNLGQHRRHRRGKQKAIVAVGNSVLVIVYHLLGGPEARFGDMGADHYDSRINKHRRARNLAAQLQALTGQRIMIRNGKAVIVEPEAA
jgi:transposase